MKLALLVALGGGAILASTAPPAKETVFYLGGEVHGYLTPCGCTKPMSGGIRRRATILREARARGTVIAIENGGLVAGVARQDVMKAEAMAQILGALGATIAVGPEEARLGEAVVAGLHRLSGGRMVATQSDGSVVPRWREASGFLIGAVNPAGLPSLGGAPPRDAAAELVAEARVRRLRPLLAFAGDRDAAKALAEDVSGLAMIVYRGPGGRAETLPGGPVLATGGAGQKAAFRVALRGPRLSSAVAVPLGPEVGDDAEAVRLHRLYLKRVEEADLLSLLPRRKGAAFAGNAACATCHTEADAVWRKSEHAGALATLERDGHARDPDCVGCHVVGLELEEGFRDRRRTPHLADVGCEACHGPGAEHSAAPTRVRMGRVGEQSCVPCHTPTQSPGFSFLTYWARIRHR